MTPERIEQLRKRYERWSMGGARDAVIVECLDEIERLKADHDASVTQWTIFLAEQRAEIERLRRELDEAITARPVGNDKNEPQGCYGPCATLEAWCPDCDRDTDHIRISSTCRECRECGELTQDVSRKPGSYWLPDDGDEEE